MIVRGKDKENPGKFAYSIYLDNVEMRREGNFDTAQAADRAAELAHREILFPTTDLPEMSDDDLLSALGL